VNLIPTRGLFNIILQTSKPTILMVGRLKRKREEKMKKG
jgi:hypothetical protein